MVVSVHHKSDWVASIPDGGDSCLLGDSNALLKWAFILALTVNMAILETI